MIPVPKHMLTRLLFPNPCCALITKNVGSGDEGVGGGGEETGYNIMTVSWLTATDNHTQFIMSLNHGRHTVSNLFKGAAFSLSPYTEATTATALLAGGSSGKVVVEGGSKLDSLGIAHTACGGKGEGFPALKDAPAHLLCTVLCTLKCSEEAEEGAGKSEEGVEGGSLKGHIVFLCSIKEGWVDPKYWKDGKLFTPLDPSSPKLVSFLGSKVFAKIG